MKLHFCRSSRLQITDTEKDMLAKLHGKSLYQIYIKIHRYAYKTLASFTFKTDII